MRGLFRRKKSFKTPEKTSGDGSDPYLDLIATKVNDANGQPFGEVVSADSDTFIIKHRGEFFSIPAGSVTNRYGDLMLASNVDLPSARKQGQRWKDQDREPIRESRTYDFSTERRLEQERNQRIHDELERARREALSTMQPPARPAQETVKGSSPSFQGPQGLYGPAPTRHRASFSLDDPVVDAGEGGPDGSGAAIDPAAPDGFTSPSCPGPDAARGPDGENGDGTSSDESDEPDAVDDSGEADESYEPDEDGKEAAATASPFHPSSPFSPIVNDDDPPPRDDAPTRHPVPGKKSL